MMLDNTKSQFVENVARANGLVIHAQAQPIGILRDDILRAAWMMAVGSCDTYFADAYADLISRALRAKDLQPPIQIPDRLNNLRVPVTAVLRQAHGGWRWRMAARELVEDENVLSLDKIKKLFNHFFRPNSKLLNSETIAPWIQHQQARSRFFGITAAAYRATGAAGKGPARSAALLHFEEHFEKIFQRRHDCIHACDRPKLALQPIRDTQVSKVIVDIEFLVNRCHEAFLAEFPTYLINLGFSGATRNQVCQ